MSYEFKPRVRCCDCVYFMPDKIGSGFGIGDCAAGQKHKQDTVLWAQSERVCNAHKVQQ